MPSAVLLEFEGRMQADLAVQVLADEGIPAVVFVDVTRGAEGEVFRERAQVRVRVEDLDRARDAYQTWWAARTAGIDAADLERQALEAGSEADAVHAEEIAPQRAFRDGAAPLECARVTDPGASDDDVCPHCGATARVGFFDRWRRALRALAGRAPAPPTERLCMLCGHRWGSRVA